MFEGLRDRSGRGQEEQDAPDTTTADLLARRQRRPASPPPETAGRTGEASAVCNKASVAGQLGMVARHASTVYGPVKEDQTATEAGQTLTVGAGIHLKGDITNCQTLIVEGHVEGSARSGVLQIADGGAFVGEAEIDTAVVSGRFDGSLTAAQRLVIRASGRVSGNIRYAAIAIEAGGQISGDIQVAEGKDAAERPPRAQSVAADYQPQDGRGDRVDIAS